MGSLPEAEPSHLDLTSETCLLCTSKTRVEDNCFNGGEGNLSFVSILIKMNFKKCHEREGFVALDIKLRPALSVPLEYVTLSGTTGFSELHGTVKHIIL